MEQFLVFLDNFRVGTTIGILVSAAACLIPAYRYIKNVKLKMKEKIKKELEEEKKEKDQEEEIKNVTTTMNEFLEKIDQSHEELLSDINKEVKELREMINETNKKVDLLIESDCDTIRTYIIDKHREAIHNQGIELIVLQQIETLYEKYQAEDGEDREFLEKLMYEIRHLPTI